MASRAPELDVSLNTGINLRGIIQRYYFFRKSPKIKTKRGRAALRKRTAVEQAISHHLVHQGRRARYKGLRKNQFDGRRHAAVSNLQVAAHYVEERQLAS